jgi:multiple sugar transport system permease protein
MRRRIRRDGLSRPSLPVGRRRLKEEDVAKYVMLAPLLVLLAALIAYPLVQLFVIAYDGGSVSSHLGRISADGSFWNSARVTLLFVVMSVALELLIGTALAIMVSDIRSTLLKAILLLPMMAAPAAVGLIWRIIFQPMFGVLNTVMGLLGLPPLGWLADPDLALLSVVIVDVWQWTPFVYLILLSGLQSLPKDPFEAAVIDGASRWQVIRHVTLPLLRPAIYLAVLFRTLDAFKALDKFVTLTNGGPGNATEVLSLYIYKVSFRFLDLGYGALLAIAAALIVIVFAQVYGRAFR